LEDNQIKTHPALQAGTADTAVANYCNGHPAP